MNNMAKHRKIEPRSREEVRLLTLASGIAFFLLIVDQITKLMVEQRMRLGESIEIVKGFFSLTFVTNKGAAWGMFHGYGIILFVIGVAVMLSAIFFSLVICFILSSTTIA